MAESVTVSGQSPVVDVTNTTVATRFDDEVLASLPGARDYWAVLAQTPAVAMGRVDVGGSGALTQQPYTAYGLASAGGVNRAEVEGIMVNEGAGGGGSDMYYTDYGAFAEIAINAVGNGAEMPNPGVLSQLIAKSGGNQYHGNVYLDLPERVDGSHQHRRRADCRRRDRQRRRRRARHQPARDVPRLQRRSRRLHQEGQAVVVWRLPPDRHRPALPDAARRHPGHVGPRGHRQVTFNAAANHKITGFYQYQTKEQPDYLGAIRIAGGRQSPALMTKDTVWHSTFPLHVWKAEYNAVLSQSLFFEVRAGAYHSVWAREGKSTDPRIEDIGNNFVSGGVWSTDLRRHRPQGNASLSYVKNDWAGTHNFKLGVEVMRDLLVQPFPGFPGADPDRVGPQQQRRRRRSTSTCPGRSRRTASGPTPVFLNDSWQVHRRLTVNAGHPLRSPLGVSAGSGRAPAASRSRASTTSSPSTTGARGWAPASI